MSDDRKKQLEKDKLNATFFGVGAAYGAATQQTLTPSKAGRGVPSGMMAAGSALGASLATSGVSGTVAAGTTVVLAKAAAVATMATAAAPFVAVAVVGYGLFKLFSSDSGKK